MKVKLNDRVMVIAGKDKGKTGRIIRVLTKNSKIVVEKLNMRIKHIKKTATRAGEKIQFEASMDSSNVAIICPSCNKPARAGYKMLANGKKERICKKCKGTLDQAVTDTGTKKGPKKVKAL